MQQVKFTQGFILQRESWREKDLSLICFTRHFGKIRVVAFGATSIHSLRGQRAQPFCLLPMQLSVTKDSKGNHKNFNLVEVESSLTEFFPISRPDNKQQLLCLASGYYVNECFLRLDKYLEISKLPINLLVQVFKQLSAAKQAMEFAIILRHFELQLFKLFGYDVYHFDEQLLESQPSRWCYDLSDGWRVCEHENIFLTHQEIKELARLSDWQAVALTRLKYHNRQLITELLGANSLHSPQWLREQLQTI